METLIDALNPHDTYREGQKEAIIETINAINDGHKLIVIDAPTGSGKSLIVEIVAKYFNLNYGDKSWVSTPKKDLQSQYINTFKRNFAGSPVNFRVMYGKTNYNCNTFYKNKKFRGNKQNQRCHLTKDELETECPYFDKETKQKKCVFNIFSAEEYNVPITCSDAPCNYMYRNKTEKALFLTCTDDCKTHCEYEVAKKLVNKADIGVMNYNLILSDIYLPQSIQSYSKRRFMFLDEAHNLYDKYKDYISVKYTIQQINKDLTVTELRGKDETLHELPYNFLEFHPELNFKYLNDDEETILKIIDTLLRDIKGSLDLKLEPKSKQRLERFQLKLTNTKSQLLQDWDNYNIFLHNDELEITPLTLKNVSNNLFSKAETIILLSGSFTNIPKRMRDFGFEDYYSISIPETRNLKENNPIHYSPIGSMSGGFKEKTFPKLCATIQKILNKHPNEKGVIHTTSYPDAQNIIKRVCNPRLITYNKGDSKNREKIIQEFKQSTNKVLVGFSIGEGVDFPNEECRFQVITKTPFPATNYRLAKEQGKYTYIAWLSDKDGERYAMLVGDKLIQMCGRGCRSDTDYCINYILDSAFSWWYKKINRYYGAENILGKHFVNSIIRGEV